MSRSTRSKSEFRQDASLSQQLSDQNPQFRKLAGCNLKASLAIARIEALGKLGYLDMKSPMIELGLAMLDAQRMAEFATSETVNEITKMGLMMPKSKEEFGKEDENDSEE